MQSLLRHVRVLHRLGPANRDRVSALRVAVSVAGPSLTLLAAGRPDLIIYAVFGALTGMYGRSEPHPGPMAAGAAGRCGVGRLLHRGRLWRLGSGPGVGTRRGA